MLWVVVLLRGFVELILEFILLSFCYTTMCVYAIKKGSEAAYLVLHGAIAVVI